MKVTGIFFFTLTYLIPIIINGQLFSSLPEVPNDITEEVGSCDALLLRLLISDHVSESDSNSLCSIFRNKIQKIDSPLHDLNCSIFGSILIGCDLKLAISSAELLRQYFAKSTRPTMKDLYYLNSILANIPIEISNILGRSEIIEDTNEIINDELSRIKKQITKDSDFDYEEIAYIFGTISQLIRLGSKNTNHIKILRSILDWEGDFKAKNILNLDSYLLNFSLLSKAYFLLKRPMDFNEIPLSIQQMAYSISKINIKDIKSICVLNEYIITRKLLIDSGIYLIQGHRKNEDKNKIANFLICKLNGYPIDGLSISLPSNSNLKINSIPKTCEYELEIKDSDLGDKQSIIEKLNSRQIKLNVSSKYLITKEISIPMLSTNGNSLNVTEKFIYLGSGLQIKKINEDIHIQHTDKILKYQLALEMKTDSNIVENHMFETLSFIEVKALEPYKTIGTRKIQLFPTLIEKNKLKIFIDITNNNFICTSNEYSIKFFMRDFGKKNSSLKTEEIARIVLNQPETELLNKLCPFKIHPNLVKFYPKEEMYYKFKEPRKMPGPFLPYLFSIIIFSSIFIVIPLWNKLAKNYFSVKTGKFSIINLLTMIFLVISLVIIIFYWHSLNIFQFTYVFTPNILIFFILLKLSLSDFGSKKNKDKCE